MALNVKNLITRSLSVLIFVIVLLSSVLFNYVSFTLFFLLVAMIGLNEFFKISVKLGAKPYKALGYICACLLYISFIDFSIFQGADFFNSFNHFKAWMICIPFIILCRAIFDHSPNSILNALYTIMGLIYAVLPFVLLIQIVGWQGEGSHHQFNPHLVLGSIFLIWANDTFAYLGGSLFGKHKMIPKVSPGKTWEGTVFGLLIAFAISFSFKQFLNVSQDWLWPILGIAVPIMATMGDLVESLLKRKSGIKDSGHIMPGHGGILDRFDSLIFVSPFVYAIAKFII